MLNGPIITLIGSEPGDGLVGGWGLRGQLAAVNHFLRNTVINLLTRRFV